VVAGEIVILVDVLWVDISSSTDRCCGVLRVTSNTALLTHTHHKLTNIAWSCFIATA